MPTTYPLIVEHLGKTAILTLTNPPVNALTVQILNALEEKLNELNQDAHVRAVVLTGAGDQFFSAGADLNQFHDGNPSRADPLLKALVRTVLAITHFDGLTIAAINGFALGGGLGLALACDVRVAERQAELAVPEGRLGMMPCSGVTQRLGELVSDGWAKRLVLTGESVGAERAERIGLVDEVVDAGFAKIVALSVAEQASHTAPHAARLAKRLMQEGCLERFEERLMVERDRAVGLIGSAEQMEGVKAFFESRSPSWRIE